MNIPKYLVLMWMREGEGDPIEYNTWKVYHWTNNLQDAKQRFREACDLTPDVKLIQTNVLKEQIQ